MEEIEKLEKEIEEIDRNVKIFTQNDILNNLDIEEKSTFVKYSLKEKLKTLKECEEEQKIKVEKILKLPEKELDGYKGLIFKKDVEEIFNSPQEKLTSGVGELPTEHTNIKETPVCDEDTISKKGDDLK